MMTVEQWKTRFTAWQKENNEEWFINEIGQIRSIRMIYRNAIGSRYWCCCCPITAEFGALCGSYNKCSRKLGLSADDAADIIEAADHPTQCDIELRKWLLETCGVKEAA